MQPSGHASGMTLPDKETMIMNILRTIMLSAMLAPVPILSRAQDAGRQDALPQLSAFLKPGAQKFEGMCNIYVQEGRYLMEIPDSLNGRDVLAAITIVKGSAPERTMEPINDSAFQEMLFLKLFSVSKIG